MSATDPGPVESASVLNDLPQFGLDYEYDDPVNPSEVTVFEAAAADRTTHWITVDVDGAVDLASIA